MLRVAGADEHLVDRKLTAEEEEQLKLTADEEAHLRDYEPPPKPEPDPKMDARSGAFAAFGANPNAQPAIP